MAASTPSNIPASSIVILPPPPSSAGVPGRMYTKPKVLATVAAATNAQTAPSASEVVPAGMPHPGRRVVLGEDGDARRAAAGPGRERPSEDPATPRSTA